MTEHKAVIFLCVENAGRSQMAEGFFRKYAPQYRVMSAGTQPTSDLNPIVVEAMNEIGIDITKQKPKKLTSSMLTNSMPVNMGCMNQESCPALFVKDVLDWDISDPKGRSIDETREIRDQIKIRVLDLIKKLEAK